MRRTLTWVQTSGLAPLRRETIAAFKILPTERDDIIDQREAKDIRLPRLALEPTLNSDADDPMLRTEATEPMDPTLRKDPREAMLSVESTDAIDQREPRRGLFIGIGHRR